MELLAAKLAISMQTELSSDGRNCLFSKKEYLTAQQITSFWSRHAAHVRRNAATARQQENLNIIPTDAQRRDPSFPTEEDELWAILSEDIELT